MDPITAGALVTGAVGFLGGERQNALNRREAHRNRMFQAAEAATNRSFQERMRNTEWQSAVADMTAAGINPAVAYSRGGASTPGGAQASGSMSAPMSDTVSSAMQALAQRKQLQLLDAQVTKAKEDARISRFQARREGIGADFDTARYMYMFTPDGTVKEPLMNLFRSEVAGAVGSSARQMHEAELAKLSIPERESLARLFESVGGAGKGVQLLLPLLSTLIRR